jgi:hypothetical protein
VVSCKEKESLYSNLLKATLPEKIYLANTAQRFAGPVWAALRQGGGDIGPEWLLTSKRIVSFRDLREPQWSAICSQATSCNTTDWAETDDANRRREFVRLLNHCLREFARTLDLCYNRELDCFYFPATPDLKPRSLTYRSLQQNTSREVFAVYHKKSNPEAVSHFRHSAFSGSFQRFGREWYLQISPTYVYTVDGHRLSRFQGDLLAGIKRFDRNAAVVGQVVMWGEYLTPTAGLFDSKYPFLQFGKPEKFQVNRTINDDAWASQDTTGQKSGGDMEP